MRTPQKFGEDDFYSRQDYYLSIPGVKNLGIKIREPKIDIGSGKLRTLLEVKQQFYENELMELAYGNKAYSNKWQKFSYEITDGEDNVLNVNFSFPASDKNWIKIDKERVIVRYDPDTKSIIEGNILLNEACGIELTKIKVSGKVYYSFGLEAFSKSGKKMDDNFKECCDRIFPLIGIKDFELKDSLSYPEFLSLL